MERRLIRRQALLACSSLIDVNAKSGDGDLYVDNPPEWDEDDTETFRRECLEIANQLIRKADRIATDA